MQENKLMYSNGRKLFILIFGSFFLFLITVIIPLWFINYFSFSVIGAFFKDNTIFSYISMIILSYIIVIDKYYFNILIDVYVIKIILFRKFYDFFRKKNFIDTTDNMLINYSFAKKPYSLDKTLILEIKTKSGKK